MDDLNRATILWDAFFASRNMESRNELVMLYLPLVKSIVRRLVPTYRKHVDFDDLMSCGVLGLMDAIDKYDKTKEVKFETYASLRVKGEIIDQIRKQDWAPISLRQKIKRVEEGFATLENKMGRAVSEQEVADHLKMDVGSVQKTLEDAHSFHVIALDELLMNHVSGSGDDSFASGEMTPEQKVEAQEMKRLLVEFIEQLPEKERLVISLYYFEELTLKEIGLTLGVSESRVSQIHSKVILSLKRKMQEAIA